MSFTKDDYEALGRACEMHGLAWFSERGEMLFQPPAEVIAEDAVRAFREATPTTQEP